MALKIHGRLNTIQWSSSITNLRNKSSLNFTQKIDSDPVFFRTKSLKLNKRSIVCASTSSNSQITELPIIPIPFVLFPGMIVPFQIFEFRYRIMMQTLLQKNHLKFGVVYHDKTTGVANVGCVVQIMKHEKLVDDRFFLICKAEQRFRVENVVRKFPYLVGEVNFLKDIPCRDPDELKYLARDVKQCMKDVVRLSDKLGVKKIKKKDLSGPNHDDISLSFFVPSTSECFSTGEQQALLELEDTGVRLMRERDILLDKRKYLAAKSAIRDVFQYTS